MLSRIDGNVVDTVPIRQSGLEQLQVCPGLGPFLLECDMTDIALTITASAYTRMRAAFGNISFDPLRGACGQARFYKSSPVPNRRNVDLRVLHIDSTGDYEQRPSVAMFYADGSGGGSWPLRFRKQHARSNENDGEPGDKDDQNGEDDGQEHDQEDDDDDPPEYLGTGQFLVSS